VDKRNAGQDLGGVPRTLTPIGYRSLSPSVSVAAVVGISLVVGGVMWSIVSHPQASAAQLPNQTAPYQAVQQVSLPEPTQTPLLAVPQKRPSLFHHTLHVTKVATVHPQQPAETYQAPQQGTYQPPPPSYPMQPAQPVVDEYAQRITEARYASSAVNLDTGDNDSQSTYAMANGSRIEASSSVMLASDSGNSDTERIGYVTHTSRYGLSEGTIIRARLITAIDSTIPGGTVEGIIVENVFDSKTHTAVVIPQGTTVIGSTEQAQSGQARLVVILKRFHFPNGQDFNVGESEGAGLKGENGMPVSVDTHAGRAFGSAIVGSALQAGMSLASRATTSLNISSGSIAQPQQLAPTMHANPGNPFDIILTRDEPFNRYEEDAE
jgi:type IV secretory pathway VirB10-like protein